MSRVVHFEIHATDPETLVGFHAGRFGWKLSWWGEIPYWPMQPNPVGMQEAACRPSCGG